MKPEPSAPGWIYNVKQGLMPHTPAILVNNLNPPWGDIKMCKIREEVTLPHKNDTHATPGTASLFLAKNQELTEKIIDRNNHDTD